MPRLELIPYEQDAELGLFPDEQLFKVIEDKRGLVGEARITPFGEMAEIGYQVVEVNRGRGIGKSICSLLLEKLPKGCSSVFAQVDNKNLASIAILHAHGFVISEQMDGSAIYTRQA